jgi:hypothetical protein
MKHNISRLQQKMLKLVTEEFQGWMNDLMKGMLDPSKIVAFLRAMGFDPSKLPGMMDQMPDFDAYKVLGLDKSASDEEVKKRYRELLHKLHPDTSGTPGTEFLLQMVMASYEMIKRRLFKKW